MLQVNNNFSNLAQSYLFSTVARKLREYTESHPDGKVIRMDIGDVTRPIAPACIEAMTKAVADMANPATFHGYGPEQGYPFLREAIVANDYKARGVEMSTDEVFVSDGAKSDIGNLGELFPKTAKVAIAEPAYPVYIDSNVMDGRDSIELLKCLPENGFLPHLPTTDPEMIYLCYPNNPTGVVMTRDELKKWVDYAREHNAVIIYDSAYEAYIRKEGIPHSIYEIEGAKQCAIEVRSFSKTAGFTGLRCGYTVVPKELRGRYANGEEASLNAMWNRRQCTKFNGASYITQRGAEAIYTPEGKKQIAQTIDYYMANAQALYDGLKAMGLEVYGGENSPYVWFRAPGDKTSWEMFDFMLEKAQVSSTPGSGFGKCGEGFVRLTAFNTAENTQEALKRLSKIF